MPQKHVLVITSVYPRTPGDRYGSFVHETIRQLNPIGIRFTVFAPAYLASGDQLIEGVYVKRFRYFPKRFENLTHGEGAPTKVQNPFYLLVAAAYIISGSWQLFWWCRQQKPDVLHVHWPFPHGLMALPAHALLGIPMIFTFHGAELLLARKFGFVSGILRWLLPRASCVTANSSFTQGLIKALYPGPVTIIPYGLTLERKAAVALPAGELPRLLFAGRMIERKGVSYLLQAVALVLVEQPVRLRLAGSGELESELKAECEKLAIESAVDFLGFVSNEELAQEYATCQIFVLPAIHDRKGDTEGLGIVMIEALAHGKPVVATSVGGIVDVVRSGVTGLLVPEKNPRALADALLVLLRDPLLAQQMGTRGQQDIEERFGWPHIVGLWQRTLASAGLSC